MVKLSTFLLVGLLCASHAHAVNKCTGVNGKITFQDAPCTGQGGVIKVTPAAGHSTSTAAPTVGGVADKPQSETEKQYQALRSERIRREKWLVMNDASSAVTNAIAQCDKEQQQLIGSKSYSANNLAGATRDVSISQEMTAAAAACSNRVRVKEKELETAEKLCQEIKCIAAF